VPLNLTCLIIFFSTIVILRRHIGFLKVVRIKWSINYDCYYCDISIMNIYIIHMFYVKQITHQKLINITIYFNIKIIILY